MADIFHCCITLIKLAHDGPTFVIKLCTLIYIIYLSFSMEALLASEFWLPFNGLVAISQSIPIPISNQMRISPRFNSFPGHAITNDAHATTKYAMPKFIVIGWLECKQEQNEISNKLILIQKSFFDKVSRPECIFAVCCSFVSSIQRHGIVAVEEFEIWQR